MPGVFISYRRDDSKGFAGALLRELNRRIGADQVFMDFEDIPGGADFPSVLKEAVASSDVVLVLIGPKWLEAKNADGTRRLDDASDYVRQEIAIALQTNSRVVPVLVDGAKMPAVGELPPDLRPLATRNALELSNPRWDEDVAKLTDHVREGLYVLGMDRGAGAKFAPDFDPLPAMNIVVKTLLIVCLGFGSIFALVAAGLTIYEVRFAAHSQRAEAEVIRIRERAGEKGGVLYSPEVRFSTPEGKSVSLVSRVSSSSSPYSVGQKVEVLYDPLRPERAVIDSFTERWFVTLFISFFAALFLPIGLIVLGKRYLKRREVNWLIKFGKPIATTFFSVEQNTAFSINDRHPFIVKTEWRNPVSKEVLRFRSGQLWEDPTQKAVGRMITVVVDPNNFGRYVVDLSFLNVTPKAKVRDL